MFTWLARLDAPLLRKSRTLGPPWGPACRLLRYPLAVIRDWLGGELNVRAMSLAYTTLLSLVPLMVFSFSILKALGARGDLGYVLHEFFRPMGGAATQLTENVMQFVTNMRADVLGSIGLAFLIYTVITTIQKVEASFNFVWRVERPRSLIRRISEYLSVMIVGPLLLAVAVGLLGSAEHSPFAQWLALIPPLAWGIALMGQFVPYAILTVVFTFMYAFIPNTRVQFKAAFIGGAAGGIIWTLVGKVFTAFILYSSQMLAVYTGFAIVLTTLIWVHLSWLILLIGAQLAFYVQFPQYLRHDEASFELCGSAREQAGLSVMYLIGRDFAAGKAYWTGRGLAVELDIPGTALAPVLERLERGGLIVATEKEELLPGRDPEAIRLASIIDALRHPHPGAQPAGHSPASAVAVMTLIENAMRERLADRSLKDLIAAV